MTASVPARAGAVGTLPQLQARIAGLRNAQQRGATHPRLRGPTPSHWICAMPQHGCADLPCQYRLSDGRSSCCAEGVRKCSLVMPDGLAADPRRAPRKQDKALQREWAWDRGLECKDLRKHWGVRCRVCLRCQALWALPQGRAQLPIVFQNEQGLLYDARPSSSRAGSRAPPPTVPAASANSRCHSPESKSSHQFPRRDACFPRAPATKHARREAQAILAQGQFQFLPLARPIRSPLGTRVCSWGTLWQFLRACRKHDMHVNAVA